MFASARFVCATLLLSSATCLADSPLPPPSTEIVRSKNKRFFAQTNPKTNTTTVYDAVQAKKPRRLWQTKSWFRSLFVGNDGQHMVAGYEGFNLLALTDARPQTVMLRFFRRSNLIRAVTLQELGLSQSNMTRTVSHYSWGRAEGFDERGRFLLSTQDGRRLIFDVRTGRLVR